MAPLIFRPRLVPTLASLAGCAVLVLLGLWQLSRHREKQDLMALAEARLAQPPVDLADALADPRANAWRRVRARGVYRLDDTILILSRRPDATGSLVLTPLVAEGVAPVGGARAAILVDRGWISFRDEEKALAATGERGGVEVMGSLVPLEEDAPGGPGPPPAKAAERRRRWFKLDLPAIRAQMAGPLLPVLLKRGDVDDGDYPEGEWAVPRPRVNHLEYAWTWFLMAAILVGVYLSASVKRAPPPVPER